MNYKKKFTIAIITLILISIYTIIGYSAIAFLKMDWSAANWSIEARGVLVFIEFSGLIICPVLIMWLNDQIK